MLQEMNGTKFAQELQPVHANLIANIYRMSCIRDGLAIDQPFGPIH